MVPFQEIADLDCSKTTAIGGTDKKSGKKNPTSITGFFIGTRKVASPKSKDGQANLHVLQTSSGNVGVWGKTNLDQKMLAVDPGQMIRISFVGMVDTKNNPMYKYKVEVDASQTIEVAGVSEEGDAPEAEEAAAEESDGGGEYTGEDEPEEESLEAEEAQPDEVPPARPAKPARPAAAPSAASSNKVKQLLAGRSAAK